MPVLAKIKYLIRRDGYITYDQMMREALSVSPHSYYQSQDRLGIDGDFITAPEISQLFGEMIGLWCISQWKKLGSPENITIVELGPGRGLLMRDLLRTAKYAPDFYQALTVELIDINQYFIVQQKANLKNFDVTINYHSDIKNIPQSSALIIANEFFDALPIKQYIKIQGLWYESVFTLQSDNIQAGKIDITETLQNHLQRTHVGAQNGAILEVSYDARKIVEFIGGHLKQFGGSSLIIDYGYNINPFQRQSVQYNSTLQAVKNHKFVPLLNNLGLSDISAHVDFYALKTIIDDIDGLEVNNITTQGEFLMAYGILIRSKILQSSLSKEQASIIAKQVDRLISHGKMGELFKVLCFSIV